MGEYAEDAIDAYYDDLAYGDFEHYSRRSYRQPSYSNETLTVEGYMKADDRGPIETEKAVLWVRNNNEEVWLPRSQIVAQTKTSLAITKWLADQRGWNHNNVNLKPGDEPTEDIFDGGFDFNDDIPF